MALCPVLGRADEHFDHVIVQAVVELALESPFELRMIEVAGMKLEIIGMHWDGRTPELDDDFHGLALGARGEIEQRVLVEFQLRKNPFQPRIRIFGHDTILTGVVVMCSKLTTDRSGTATTES